MITVIIPVYNCANFVRTAICSVLQQTYSDIELILINDGSTDDTLKVTEKIAKGDERVRIITVPNGGPAKARNIGLSQAKGDYVYFMDSDDTLELNALEAMVTLATENELSVVCSGYRMEHINKKNEITSVQYFSYPKGGKESTAEAATVAKSKEELSHIVTDLIDKHLIYTVWNKLYKRSFLLENSLTFSDYMSGEDRLFNLNMLCRLDNIGVLSQSLYNYALRGKNSLAGRYVKDRFKVAKLCFEKTQELELIFNLHAFTDIVILHFAFVKLAIASISQLYKSPLSHREKTIEIRSILNDDMTVLAVNSCKIGFGYRGIVCRVLATKSVFLTRILTFFIYQLQIRCGPLFLKIKQSGR